MRIAVVSAHFPPNFVSGGTLQPQRLARALRDLGHDVWVYAGWLGEGRMAGSSWQETDETGLPVWWVATSEWIHWDDTRNFDNPSVDADFERFLDAARPEVVHLHALQSLGAGLASVAARRAIPVVLTMHDLWWCCARQFLVNRELQPCSLVVDAGTCPCEVDKRWLERRNRALLARLSCVDSVLAPSAALRDVLAANGLAPGRVEVDENGVPARQGLEPGTLPRPDPRKVVRFTYMGGPHPLKGVHVAFEAARRLEPLTGWSLRAYGADTWAREQRLVLPPTIEARPRFDEADAEGVWAETDVLLVPSVARESYSLVTREALLRGVPVICSDSLGPEEVVVDGDNGFVVPAADDEMLALAMARIVTETGLLDHLRAGARARPPTVRTLTAQASGLDQRYRHLVSGHRPAGAQERAVNRVLFVTAIEGAPLRYRVRLPAEALALVGVASDVRWFTDPELPAAVDAADIVVLYRVPATDWIRTAIDRAHQQDKAVLFDVDDLIVDPSIAPEVTGLRSLPAGEVELWVEGVRRYRTTMEWCDVFVASTEPLAREVAAVSGVAVERYDNGVGLLLAQRSDRELQRPRTPGPLRVGYFSGTVTHDQDWFMIEPAVAQVLEQRSDVELWLGGLLPEAPALARFGDRVRRIPFQHWLDLPALLRDVDVNLAPLELPSRFNEAKSAIKWLEAALVGTPTVASPTVPMAEAITDGANGLLADGTLAWRTAIGRVLDDGFIRRRLGAAARRDALLRWSPHLQGRRYLDLLERAAAGGPVRSRPEAASAPGPAWSPVIVVESPRPHLLEPYAPEPPGRVRRRARLALARHRLRTARDRIARHVREDGLPATVGWIAMAGGRRLLRLVRARRRRDRLQG